MPARAGAAGCVVLLQLDALAPWDVSTLPLLGCCTVPMACCSSCLVVLSVKCKYRKKCMTGLPVLVSSWRRDSDHDIQQVLGRAVTYWPVELVGLEWGMPEAPWTHLHHRAKKSLSLQGEEMLLLPFSSRVFSPVEEVAARVPAPTPFFPALYGRWVTGRSKTNSFFLFMCMGRLILCIELVIKDKHGCGVMFLSGCAHTFYRAFAKRVCSSQNYLVSELEI